LTRRILAGIAVIAVPTTAMAAYELKVGFGVKGAVSSTVRDARSKQSSSPTSSHSHWSSTSGGLADSNSPSSSTAYSSSASYGHAIISGSSVGMATNITGRDGAASLMSPSNTSSDTKR
jgi:hypothetical protein